MPKEKPERRNAAYPKEDFYQPCIRCRATRAGTSPIPYCYACARYLEGLAEREDKRIEVKTVHVTIFIISQAILVMDQLPWEYRTVDTLIKAIKFAAFKMTSESDVISEEEFDISDVLIQQCIKHVYERRINNPWNITKQTPPESAESIFDLFEAEEPILEQPSQQIWDWNPDDEQDWTDSYDVFD